LPHGLDGLRIDRAGLGRPFVEERSELLLLFDLRRQPPQRLAEVLDRPPKMSASSSS